MGRRTIMDEAGFNQHKLSTDEALALDYALGILTEPDRLFVLKRIKQDTNFGHLVSRYRDQLSAVVTNIDPIEDTLIAPRSQTWNTIFNQISTAGHS